MQLQDSLGGGRLPAPRFPDDAQRLAGIEVEIDTAHSMRRLRPAPESPPPGRKPDLQALHLQQAVHRGAAVTSWRLLGRSSAASLSQRTQAAR